MIDKLSFKLGQVAPPTVRDPVHQTQCPRLLCKELGALGGSWVGMSSVSRDFSRSRGVKKLGSIHPCWGLECMAWCRSLLVGGYLGASCLGGVLGSVVNLVGDFGRGGPVLRFFSGGGTGGVDRHL